MIFSYFSFRILSTVVYYKGKISSGKSDKIFWRVTKFFINKVSYLPTIGNNRHRVFARGVDGEIYQRWWINGAWRWVERFMAGDEFVQYLESQEAFIGQLMTELGFIEGAR